MTPQRVLVASFLALTLVPTAALADPVRLTGGFFSVTGIGTGAVFDMEGDGFRATGRLERGVVWPDLTCFPCASGATIRLDSAFLVQMGFGSATVGTSVFPDVTLGARDFVFTAPTIVSPAVAGDFTVTQPFTFGGRLFGFYPPNEEDLVFDQSLVGHGVLTASFGATPNPDGPPLFFFRSIRYDFSDAAPVPEPGTLLLCATGVAAAIRFRKRLGVPNV